MKKILLVTALLVLCFSGVSNADLLYQDTKDYYIGGWFGPSQKAWDFNTGSVGSAQLSISFFALGVDCLFPEFAEVTFDKIVLFSKFEVDTGTITYNFASGLSPRAHSLQIFAKGGDFLVTDVKVNGAPVPEPATMVLFGAGLLALAGYGRKKFKN